MSKPPIFDVSPHVPMRPLHPHLECLGYAFVGSPAASRAPSGSLPIQYFLHPHLTSVPSFWDSYHSFLVLFFFGSPTYTLVHPPSGSLPCPLSVDFPSPVPVPIPIPIPIPVPVPIVLLSSSCSTTFCLLISRYVRVIPCGLSLLKKIAGVSP